MLFNDFVIFSSLGLRLFLSKTKHVIPTYRFVMSILTLKLYFAA